MLLFIFWYLMNVPFIISWAAFKEVHIFALLHMCAMCCVMAYVCMYICSGCRHS